MIKSDPERPLGAVPAALTRAPIVRVEEIAYRLARKLFRRDESSVCRLQGGVMNHMFRVELSSQESYVLRIYPLGRKKVAHYEPEMLQRLSASGCTVASVIDSFCPNNEKDPAWLAYRFIPGNTFAQRRHQIGARALRFLADGIVDNLKKIASLRVEGFGRLLTAHHAATQSAKEFMLAALDGCLAATARTGTLPNEMREVLRKVADEERRAPEWANGELAWGDLAPANIIVDGRGRLAGLVDFESLIVFDCSLSVGYLRALEPEDPLMKAIISSAVSAGLNFSERAIRLTSILRAARMATHAHVDLPSGHAQRDVLTMMPGAVLALREFETEYPSRSNG